MRIAGSAAWNLLSQRTHKQIQPSAGPTKLFGAALRAVREERGISQEQLALEAKCDRS